MGSMLMRILLLAGLIAGIGSAPAWGSLPGQPGFNTQQNGVIQGGACATLNVQYPILLSRTADVCTLNTTIRDPRSCSTPAKCDGTTDDRDAIQSCIDAATAAGGGTIMLPSMCAIGPGAGATHHLVMKNHVSIQGVRGAGLRMKSGADALIDVGNGIDDWSIVGLQLQQGAGGSFGNQKPLVISGSGDSLNFWFLGNTVQDVFTTASAAYNLITLNCLDDNDCHIESNSIYGSGTPAANDTCMHVETSATDAFGGACTIVSDNYIEYCGADGLDIVKGVGNGCATVTGNTISAIQQNGISTDLSFSTFTGDFIKAGTAAGDDILYTGSGDSQFENNIMPPGSIASGWAFHSISTAASPNVVGGLHLIGNYLGPGVYFESRGFCSPTHTTTQCRTNNSGGSGLLPCPGAGETCLNFGGYGHNKIVAGVVSNSIHSAGMIFENWLDGQVDDNTISANDVAIRVVNMGATNFGQSQYVSNKNFAISTRGSGTGIAFIEYLGPGNSVATGAYNADVMTSNQWSGSRVYPTSNSTSPAIPSPSGPPTVAGAFSNDGTLGAQTYSIVYTMNNTSAVGETDIGSSRTTATVSSSQNAITVSGLPASATNCSGSPCHVNIYVGVGAGNERFAGFVSGGTTTYTIVDVPAALYWQDGIGTVTNTAVVNNDLSGHVQPLYGWKNTYGNMAASNIGLKITDIQSSPNNTVSLYDEFVGGVQGTGTSAGTVGSLGWTVANDGTSGCNNATTFASIAGRPGVYQIKTGATNSGCNMTLSGAGSFVGLNTDNTWNNVFSFTLGQTTVSKIWAGFADRAISSSSAIAASSTFFGIRFDPVTAGDTAYVCYSRDAGTDATAVSTGVAPVANTYNRFVINHVPNGTNGCTQANGCLQCAVDTSAPVVVNSAPISSVAVFPDVSLASNSTATKLVNIDYWSYTQLAINGR